MLVSYLQGSNILELLAFEELWVTKAIMILSSTWVDESIGQLGTYLMLGRGHRIYISLG